MTIDVAIDSTALVRRLKNGERRLGYAAVNAVNNTLKRVQTAEQEHVAGEFRLRRPDFVQRQAAIIKPFASVGQQRPYGEIAVGQKPRLLLAAFEAGGERQPFTPGAKRVAVPVVGGPARPQFGAPVMPELRLSRLRFGRTKTGRRRAAVVQTGTYLVPSTGIFQRERGGKSRLVYFFARDEQLAPRLGFVETAERTAAQWFREEMEREVVHAIARAGGEGL